MKRILLGLKFRCRQGWLLGRLQGRIHSSPSDSWRCQCSSQSSARGHTPPPSSLHPYSSSFQNRISLCLPATRTLVGTLGPPWTWGCRLSHTCRVPLAIESNILGFQGLGLDVLRASIQLTTVLPQMPRLSPDDASSALRFQPKLYPPQGAFREFEVRVPSWRISL